MDVKTTRVRQRYVPNLKKGTIVIGTMKFRPQNETKFRPLEDFGSTSKVFVENSTAYKKKEYCVDELHKGPPFKSGGPFRRVKIELSDVSPSGFGTYLSAPNMVGPFGVGQFAYTGGFIIQNFLRSHFETTGIFQPNYSGYELLIPDLTALGPNAWRRTAPNIEYGGLAIALGESRDIPRMLRNTSETFHLTWKDLQAQTGIGNSGVRDHMRTSWVMQPKKVANTYLNAQFGWVPFLKDVNKMLEVAVESQSIIERITSANGKWRRKRKDLDLVLRDNPLTAGNASWVLPQFAYFPGSPGFYRSAPQGEARYTLREHTYSVGKFYFYSSQFDISNRGQYDSAINTVRRHLAIHGLRINPSNLYRVTPWTWLIDWFSNVGDNVANASSMLTDAVASEYFYVMQHRIEAWSFRQTLPFWSGDVTLNYASTLDVKQREDAVSPFGLSLSLPLTGRQISILGALGISRRS